MPDPALKGVTVLELATGVAGPYCGRLLADLGARVIKAEPPGGDPLRAELPVIEGESAYFAWLNAGKEGVAAAPDDDRLDGLVTMADVIVHSERGPAADALEARWLELNPRALVISLSPYGRNGQRSNWQATALTEYATGGFHYFGGKADREPLALPGFQVESHAGMHAAIAALSGLWHAQETGRGQRVEISHQEAMLAAHSWLTSMWSHTGQVQQRAGNIYTPCRDGFVYLFHMVPYPNLFVLIERFDLLEDESYADPVVWAERFPETVAAFAEWAADRTKEEIYHAAQELRIAVSPVSTMSDLAENAHLAERDFFGVVEVAGRELQAPGAPAKLLGTPAMRHSRAPRLGEHDALLDLPVAATASPVHEGGARMAGPGPLAGVRVLEVTANWAGPMAGRHLADLGADVIKVELATKPATRSLVFVAGDMTWPRLWERSGYFNKLNRNKREICLNLATEEGRNVFLTLVKQADVVVENNAARVMPQLKLGYEDLRKVNPGIIMASLSGYGASGPLMNYSAYGSNIETASGLASVLGYGPGDQNGTGSFYADPVSGGQATVAILAALHARRATGEGQWIDVSLLESVMPFFAQQFLTFGATGENPVPDANRHPAYFPQDVYQTAGADCWLALSITNNEQWTELCRVIGRSGWGREPGMATPAQRRACRAEIDAAIRAWTAVLDHNDAAERLQAAGVPAAPVMANWEVLSDNHLHQRGFFVTISHPVAGTFPWPGFVWRFSGTPAAVRYPAPLFGQHNHEIFTELAGLSEAEVTALYDRGITADEPVYAAGVL